MRLKSEKMFIYVLINPLDDMPFYIGQSKNVEIRLLDHLHKSYLKRTPKDIIISEIIKNGLLPKWEVIEEIIVDIHDKKSIFNVSDRERFWVSEYSKKYSILNKQLSIPENIDNIDLFTKIECLYCGSEAVVKNKKKKFCSDKCRVYWNRENKSGGIIGTPSELPVSYTFKEVQEISSKIDETKKVKMVVYNNKPLQPIIQKPEKLKGEDDWDYRIRLAEWKEKQLK